MYRKLINLFLSEYTSIVNTFFSSLDQGIVSKRAKLFPGIFEGELSHSVPTVFQNFQQFVDSRGSVNPTFKFWSNFCFRDVLNYVGLYMAIRSRDYNLRGACIRQLVPLFHALDRTNYLRVVPIHMATLKTCPSYIVKELEAGAFAVSLSGFDYQCVALDEAHEMGINKQVKMAMNATNPEGLSRLTHYLPFRSKVNANISSQLKLSTNHNTNHSAHHTIVKNKYPPLHSEVG